MLHPLYSNEGKRLYLIPDERIRFLEVVEGYEIEKRTFCKTLAYTGCRISEALAMPASRVDYDAKSLVFHTLKQRREDPIYRPVPAPMELLDDLVSIAESRTYASQRLWPWGRTHGFHIVKAAMEEAEIFGAQAMPKGLRHGYAVNAILCDIPLIFVQRWMGHASLETTKLYLQVAGDLAYGIAERMWSPRETRCCHCRQPALTH